MKILDNITNTVRDDLRVEIKKGSRVSIAAACFSMYAYKELKKQLETIDEFEFIFRCPECRYGARGQQLQRCQEQNKKIRT